MCHGPAAAEAAAETARRTFEEGALGQDLPTVEVPRDRLAQGIPAYELLRESGLTASNGEARRLIKGGGGRLNDAAIAGDDRIVNLDDLNPDGLIKLSAGKKRHALVRVI
jgi:tyrosyl-tRNA synthetase